MKTYPCPTWCDYGTPNHNGDHWRGGEYTAATRSAPIEADQAGAIIPAIAAHLARWRDDGTDVVLHIGASGESGGMDEEIRLSPADAIEHAAHLLDAVCIAIDGKSTGETSVETLTKLEDSLVHILAAHLSPTVVTKRTKAREVTQAIEKLGLPTQPTDGLVTWVAGRNTAHEGQVFTTGGTWHLSPLVSDPYRRDPDAPVTQLHEPTRGLQIPVENVRLWAPASVNAEGDKANGQGEKVDVADSEAVDNATREIRLMVEDIAKVTATPWDRVITEMELPTKPTYGVVTWHVAHGPNQGTQRSMFGMWHKAAPIEPSAATDPLDRLRQLHCAHSGMQVAIRDITNWTKAYVVPMDDVDNVIHDVPLNSQGGCTVTELVESATQLSRRFSRANGGRA